MASYFNRDNVGLPGLTSYFRAESLDERGHAQMLMDFQVQTLLTCWQTIWARPFQHKHKWPQD